MSPKAVPRPSTKVSSKARKLIVQSSTHMRLAPIRVKPTALAV